MSPSTRLLASVLFALTAWTGTAHAQTATLEVLAPENTSGKVVPDTQYDLRINYSFAGGTVTNPKIDIDLPPGVILVDVGAFSAFTGSCNYEGTSSGTYTSYLDWKCSFSAASIEVPSGGVSGQIPLRIRFMPFYFQDEQQVTLSATLSGTNFTQKSASDVSIVDTTLAFVEPGWGHQTIGFTRQNTTSPVGPITFHQRSPDNGGSQYVHPGLELRETYPTGTKFLGKWYNYNWTINNVAWSDATSLVHSTPYRFGFGYVSPNGNGSLGNKGIIYNNTEWLYPLLWNECGSVPSGATWTSQLWGSKNSDGSGFAQFLPADYPGAFSASQGGSHAPMNCTTPVQTGWSLGTPSFGTWFSANQVIYPPTGAVPAYDVFSCFALPPGLEYRQPSVSVSYAQSQNAAADFNLYRCNVPSLVGSTFKKADFDTYLASGACVAWTRNDSTIYNDTQVTHFVSFAAELSSPEAWGETVFYYNYVGVQLRKNSCGGSSTGINYKGYVSARRTQNAALEEATSNTSQTLDNLQWFNAYGYIRTQTNQDMTTAVKGTTGKYQIYPQSELGINPWGTQKFPKGIRVLNHRWVSYNNGCDNPDYDLLVRPMADGTTEVDVDLGPDSAPWNTAYDCVNSLCQPSGYGYIEIDFYVDPAFNFTDGQIITFTTAWNSENNRYGSIRTSSDTLTISVPAEMSLRLEPTCSGEPGGGTRQLGVLARISNAGGLPLTQKAAILPIPKIGDGSGTEINTTYVGHLAPAGVTVECSTNGGSSWSTTCSASATHVRYTVGTLAAYETREVELYLGVPANTPTGASVYVTGALDSAELLPIASASVAPSKVNLCPGRAVVNLWFDEDGDGVRDSTEPALSTWPLTITSPDGETYEVEFEPNGTVEIALPGGTSSNPQRYTYEVTNPTTGQAVWSWTAEIPADIAVVADGTVTIDLPATCACDDELFCTTDSCNFLGQCSFQDRDPIPGVADAVCDGVDNNCNGDIDEDYEPMQVICGFGACQSVGESTCENGFEDREFGTCVPNDELAEDEVCDAQDNDCDGLVDAQDPDLVLVECEKQQGVCAGSLKTREMCVTRGESASWTACTDPVYAAYAYPYGYVNSSLKRDFCGDPLVPTSPTKPAGVDNDCDGLVDEDHVVEVTDCGIGACQSEGTLSCVNGQVIDTCEEGNAGTFEICNGIDDDCDGLTDLADPDIVRENCSNQAGVCSGAKKTVCNGAAGWAACTASDYASHAAPNYASTDATCDNRDNDCSGQVDEDFVGGSVSCGNGVCAVTGTQVCQTGVVKVRIGTTTYDTCTPNTAASTAETCDGLDNDCDGQLDAADTTLVKPNCELQSGVCAGSKKPATLCVNGSWQTCNPTTYTSYAATYATIDATCNGVDNDCSGAADEDYEAPITTCGVGRCAGNSGRLLCENGSPTDDTCDPYANAVDELCNGQDDDCNGLTDEAFEVGETCTVGQFDCASTGRYVCSSTGLGVVCDAPVINGTNEICDGKDNDCDGNKDEDFSLGAACTVGVGACARTGVRQCRVDGSAGCSATAGTGSVELCDAIDNDCDGATDEGVCKIDTAITAGPDEVVSVSTATFNYVDTVTSSNTNFQCQFDGGEWFECDGGTLTLSEVGDGSHTFLVRAVGPTGIVDDTPAYWTWEVDTTVPDTFVLSGPQDPSQSPDADFVFGTNVANPSAWYCAIDPVGDAPSEDEWVPCDATWSWSDLTDGQHTIWVYVVNELGIADTTPATYSWLIDTTAPGTSILTGPSLVTCETSASFTFASPDDPSVTSFRCRLDAGEWTSCGEGKVTFNGLADGPHTFSVASVDANGNVDPTPSQTTWTVDTAAPTTSLDLVPQNPAQNSNASFAFSSNELGATFFCKLDTGSYQPCTSPRSLTGLADGTHSFSVYAADRGCKVDETPATYTWVIDTRFPDTAFVTTPPIQNGYEDENDFTYEDPTDPELDTFDCKLDGGEWVSCDGGSFEAGVLEIGTHTMMVRACDMIGETVEQCDPTPAVYTWEVTSSPCPLDRDAPAITCVGDQTIECVSGAATVDLVALRATATDACAPVSVTTESSASAPLGVSPLVYEAVDGNGNVASCVTRVSVVDRVAPTIACPAPVELTAPDNACGLAHDLGAATVGDACHGTSVSSFSNAPAVFGVGETVVTYTALDPSGNTATCTTTVTVVDKTPVTLVCEEEVTKVAPADACAWSGTLTATATDNCAVDVTVVERTNTYAVGVQNVEFTAEDDAGNSAACTTVLTVSDETAPTIACGTLTGSVPATVTATATDACTATATVTGFTCYRVEGETRTELDDAACPVTYEGAVLTVTGRLEAGELEIGYGVEAVDPSGNRATEECVLTFAADADKDGVVDADDNCPTTANTDQTDSDEDGLGDACDVCPDVADAEQVDSDDNGIGDLCQDTDADEVLDTDDNCPVDANGDQLDWDEDGLGNVCDAFDDKITASGSGCAGGSTGFGLMGVIAGLGLVMMRRRRVS